MDSAQSEKNLPPTKHLEMLDGKSADESEAHGMQHASPAEAMLLKVEKRVILKQDLTVVLLLAGCYFFAYLDRGAIGNARVMGFQKDLGMTSKQFYDCLLMFYVGYMIFELPASLSLRVFRPPWVYGGAVISFGVCSACMALVRTWAPVMVIRLLIGVTEAFVQTGFVFISLWYQKNEITTRCALYYGATPIAGAFSGLIAYGVDKNLDGTLGKTSWEWFFIIEGVLTIFWGLLVFILLPSLPETVAKRGSWLFRTEAEHTILMRRTIQANNTPDAKPRMFQVVWAMKDPKTWLGALIIAAPCLNVAAFGTFLPTFIQEFGFSRLRTQLMSMIPYAFAAVTLPTMAILADKLQKRAIPILACLGTSLIGFIMILTSVRRSVLLAGCCFVAAGSYPALIIAASWQLSSHAGYTKRSTAWATSQVFIQCYSIISTQIYTEPPRYFKGHGTLLGLNAVGVGAVLLNYWLMSRENARRDKRAEEYARNSEEVPDSEKDFEEMCDRHPQFRKAQLTLENDELRSQLNQDSRQTLPSFPTVTEGDARCQRSWRDLGPQLAVTGDLTSPVVTSPDVPLSFGAPEKLDGLEMVHLESCFNLFFKHYASFLPGVFASNSPFLGYYERSPFLFWTIICTGARHFQNPAFFQKVGTKTRDLTAGSILQVQDPIPTIQAILILCLWPLPLDTMWKDPSHALAGAAMQLAVQNGLHKAQNEQDFRRVLISSSDGGQLFRVRLWLHCVMVFQSTSTCDGLPFSTLPDCGEMYTEKLLHSVEDQALLDQYKIHRLQTKAIAAFLQNNDLQESSKCKGISVLINVFDSQIQEVGVMGNNSMTTLASTCARLSVLAFHLFSPMSDSKPHGLVCLLAVCTDVLDLATKLDATQVFAWYSTNYYLRMVLLAAFCVLRILRSRLRKVINTNEAEQSFFKAINFVRNRSTLSTDLDARYAIILKQLYSSETAFLREDGEVDGLRLDIRSRLFMSIVFDSFWWWRAEFDGRANPYLASSVNITNPGSTGSEALETHADGEVYSTMPVGTDLVDTLRVPTDFTDWNWPASLDLDDGQLQLAGPY
ncbi:hypothetical protein PV08_00503 [Exophiala spinifera]|uniref:Xylanolytic transcriptional activator regulatory domain-containing protein n=1 Tax=Exophiala spinifera TaxID=91928 RepID=A0A0D2BLV5_9EURO|nr:uncharacterized protein PV08_00503 [Exophiala spinifera]KIW19928.1 hypothetical protein PV08_00503 [Exophiala spinifera]